MESTSDAPVDLVVPPWAESLPCCVFALLKFFYLDLLRPEDTFVASIRKVVIAFGPFALTFGPLIGHVGYVIEHRDDLTDAVIPLTVRNGLLLGFWVPLYLGTFTWGKCRPDSAGSSVLVDVWTLGTAIGVVLQLVLVMPTAAWYAPLAMTMYLAIICRGPLRALTCIVAGAGCLISVYNRGAFDWPDTPRTPLIAIPEVSVITCNTLRTDLMLSFLNAPMVFCLELVLRESDRCHAASKASAVLAKRLAAALTHYDTKRAREALKDAEAQEVEHADAELVEGFRAIVRNLDEYRPHLPNWLVNKHSASAPASPAEVGLRVETEDDTDPKGISGRRRRASNSDDTMSISARSRRSSVGSDSGTASVFAARRRSSSLTSPVGSPCGPRGTSAPASRAGASITKTPLTRGLHGHSVATTPRVTAAPQHPPPITPLPPSITVTSAHGAAPAPCPVPLPQLRTVAMAELQFSVAALAELRTAQRAAALHGFVDRVHEVARATKAAVHAFVGDAVVASWNAARACAHPEAKAARFAARLRESATVRVTGAVMGGAGSALMAGLAEQRALLASLRPEAQALLRRAAHEGAHRDAILLPASVADALTHVVDHELAAIIPATGPAHPHAQLERSVDVLASPFPATIQTRPLMHVFHAITREVPPESDDWVYVLEQRRDEPASGDDAASLSGAAEASRYVLTRASEAAQAGDFATALAALQPSAVVAAESSAHTARVERLIADVEFAMQQQGAAAA